MSAARPLANSPASSGLTLSGVSARSFQRWMMWLSTRAGHFLSSIFSACRSCLIRRVWSSVSRMVKLLLSPTSSAWRRSTRTPMAWKVPSHMPSAAPPIRLATRSSISRAALLVKVTARICAGRWLGAQGGVEARRPGGESNLPAEVVDALPAVVGVHTTVPENRRSAQTLGAEREGHGIVIDDEGLVVTIGYLIMEAATVTVTDSEDRKLDARIVGYDYESGFGLVRTIVPPPARPMGFGDSDSLSL